MIGTKKERKIDNLLIVSKCSSSDVDFVVGARQRELPREGPTSSVPYRLWSYVLETAPTLLHMLHSPSCLTCRFNSSMIYLYPFLWFVWALIMHVSMFSWKWCRTDGIGTLVVMTSRLAKEGGGANRGCNRLLRSVSCSQRCGVYHCTAVPSRSPPSVLLLLL